MSVSSRPFHRNQRGTAPFAADTETLNKPDGSQDDRTPDADRVVARDEADGERRKTCQQQGRNQRHLAPDAVSVMAEQGRADRAGDKADGVDPEGLQYADQRIGFREIQFREDQRCNNYVEKEVVRLDNRADGAREDRATKLTTVLALGKGVCGD